MENRDKKQKRKKDLQHFIKKNKRKINKITTVLIFVGIVMCIFYIVLLLKLENDKNNPKLEATPCPTPMAQSTEQPATDATPQAPQEIDTKVYETLEYLKPYYEENNDLVGWIKVNNTMVDYPVVYSGDNEYYLEHNFKKEKSKEGAIFLDFRCDIRDLSKTRNIILYGHRMKDDTMFKTLLNYEDSRFFFNNSIIKFDLLHKECEWEVFAVFKTPVDFYYIETYFENDVKWMNFIQECYAKSMHPKYVEFEDDDIVLTLSTCTTKKNERFVVMARLIKDKKQQTASGS
jgi:sortase B